MNDRNLVIILIALIIIVGIIFFIDGHDIVSVTLSGGDVIFQPKQSADWYVEGNSTSVEPSKKGFHFTRLNDGTNAASIFKDHSIHSIDGTGNLVFEFDYRTANQFGMYLLDNNGEKINVGESGAVNNTWVHEKWVYDSTNQTVTEYTNGVERSPVDLSSKNMTTLGFQVVDWQGDIDLYIEDWKVSNTY